MEGEGGPTDIFLRQKVQRDVRRKSYKYMYLARYGVVGASRKVWGSFTGTCQSLPAIHGSVGEQDNGFPCKVNLCKLVLGSQARVAPLSCQEGRGQA